MRAQRFRGGARVVKVYDRIVARVFIHEIVAVDALRETTRAGDAERGVVIVRDVAVGVEETDARGHGATASAGDDARRGGSVAVSLKRWRRAARTVRVSAVSTFA